MMKAIIEGLVDKPPTLDSILISFDRFEIILLWKLLTLAKFETTDDNQLNLINSMLNKIEKIIKEFKNERE